MDALKLMETFLAVVCGLCAIVMVIAAIIRLDFLSAGVYALFTMPVLACAYMSINEIITTIKNDL